MTQTIKKDIKDPFAQSRNNMVEDQIVRRGVEDQKVLDAMRQVPRHLFVPPELESYAHDDRPLLIGEDQTISQPYIVAYMTEQLFLTGDERVLEIGTGSGYQTAVLAEIVKEVYTIEIKKLLAKRAQTVFDQLGYGNITAKCDDGYLGYKQQAPFEAIMITAAPKQIPRPLVNQLTIGGKMIVPIGSLFQELVLITRVDKNQFDQKPLLPVRFVPMVDQKDRTY